MRDPETFETRLTAVYRRFADEVTTDVDPMALARTIVMRPVRRPLFVPRFHPLRLAVVLGLLVALALGAAALVGGQPSPEPPSIRPVPSASPNATTVASGSADTAVGRLSWTAIQGDAQTIPGGDIFATPGGFAAIEPDADGRGSRFWVSPDGLDWAVAPLPVPAGGAIGHGVAGGEHWIWSERDFRLWRSSDFATWIEVDLAALAPPAIAGIDWTFWSSGPVTVGTTTVLPGGIGGGLALSELFGVVLQPGEVLTVGGNRREPSRPSLGDVRDVFRKGPYSGGADVCGTRMTRVGAIRVELDGSIVTVFDADRDIAVAEIDAAIVGLPPAALADDLNLRGQIPMLGGGAVVTDGVVGAFVPPTDVRYLEAVDGRFVAMTGEPGSKATRLVWASTNGLDWESLGPPVFPSDGAFLPDLLDADRGPEEPLTATATVEEAGTQRLELWSSVDGLTWKSLGVVDPIPGHRVTPGLGGYLATGDDLRVHVSATGADWSAVDGLEFVIRSAEDDGVLTAISATQSAAFIVELSCRSEDRVLWVLTIDANE